MMKHGAVAGKVLEVQDLQHLESVVDKAGSSLLVVFFHTRSCGVCKELLKDFKQLCEEVRLLALRVVCWGSCPGRPQKLYLHPVAVVAVGFRVWTASSCSAGSLCIHCLLIIPSLLG
jgi:thiol-disulfide isomerase/thioredoxin